MPGLISQKEGTHLMKSQHTQWLLPVSLSVSLIACTPAPQSLEPGNAQPSASTAPGTPTTGNSATPGTNTPSSETSGTEDVTLPTTGGSVTPPLVGSSGCTPLVNINGSEIVSSGSETNLNPLDKNLATHTVKGYLRLTSTLSCSTDVKSVQYMYRLVPSGEYIVIGALQKPEDSYAFELNTSNLLVDGSYELITKATLNDGNIILSSPLRIDVDNVEDITSSSGGGGGGGGSTGGGDTGGGDTGGGDTGGGNTGGGGTGNVNFAVDTSFNIPAGTTRWTLDVGEQVSSTPLVDAEGNAFFAADNKFFIYDKNGVKISELTLPSDVTAPAARYQDIIYFGDSNGKLIKIDVSNPASPQQTDFILSGTGASARFEYNAPAIDCQGNVYIQTRDRKLYKVNATGGQPELILQIPDQDVNLPAGATTTARYASPVIDNVNNRVFTGSQNGIRIASLDGSNPASFIPSRATSSSSNDVAAQPLDQAINSPLAVDEAGNAYAVSETGTLYKFNPASPEEEIWRTFVGDGDGAPVIGSDGTVYIASENGVLKMIDPSTGGTIHEIGLGNVVEFSSPAIGRAADDSDIIYVGTEGGLLYSFNGTNSTSPATQRMVKDLGAPIRSDITISADGTVYAGTLDGRMFTIFGDSIGLADTPWPKSQGGLNGTGQFGTCPPPPSAP